MNLTEEQLKEVEQFAEWLFSPQEISIILELDEKLFQQALRDKLHPVHKSYMTGKYRTEALMRQRAITFMKQGSTPALAETLKMSQRQNTAMLKR